jgi:uncharacterized protein YdeI (YjbR/CyaY-like superfamily)
MPTTDPRVDAYIEKSRDFAKPILAHLRKLVHDASPDIDETIKWGMPNFGHKGIVCNMAAFKEHCAFGFWKHSLIEDAALPKERTAMGSFGRITSLTDLPDDATMKKLIAKAVKLNDDGIKTAKPKTTAAEKKELVVPEILTAALESNTIASETFNKFPYSCKKEYIEWITEAKTEATREKRLATTVEWLSEGKRRNWKYENC